jgi:hypothetical protein
MRTFHLLPVLLLAACASVDDRPSCSVSTDCPRGQYCAHTPDGSVCWPDAVPPTVSGVSVSCEAPTAGGACLRDGTLRVAATLADDAEVLGADVTLDLGGPAVPMQRGAGGQWTAAIPLRDFPFEHFSHGVVATVTARDGARNETPMDASGVTTVTRLRWEIAINASLAPLAVNSTGILAIPTNNGKSYLLTWDGSFVASVQTGSNLQQPTAATAVGASFWVGNDAGDVFEVSDDTSSWASTVRASTSDSLHGSLAVLSNSTVIAVSDGGVVYAVTSSTPPRNSTPLSPPAAFSVGAVVDAVDGIFAVASGSAYRFTLAGGFPITAWANPVALGGQIVDPVACSTELVSAANAGAGGLLRRTSPAGDPELAATVGIPAGGAAILADSSIVVPEQTKTLSRWTSTGLAFPGWQKPDLGGATRTPLVVTSGTPFVVPTAKGALHALRPDGTIAWSGQLSAGTASLQPGNIYTRGTEPAGAELSTAYFAGSDGVLHAVIVDGRLDASAPWPKAFHDARNTNRAGAPQ